MTGPNATKESAITLPNAPTELPRIEQHLRSAMNAWMQDASRPTIARDVEQRWDRYVDQWIATPELPLFVRVTKGDGFEKGCSVVRHGRTLIRCDNSPAKWIFRLAYERPDLRFEEFASYWHNRWIPVAMVITRAARCNQSFAGLPALGHRGVGDEGWELSHRREVKLDGRLDTANLAAFEEHFRRLMQVSNMVLTPMKMGMNHLVDCMRQTKCTVD